MSGCTEPATNNGAFRETVAKLEQQAGGVIGVYALDLETGLELAYREDERFAMASTFKPLLVAAILERVDAGELELGASFQVDPTSLVTYSPVTKAVAAGQTITLEALCEAVMTISDNTAANMLLGLIGGPAGLTGFLRKHDDNTTRLDRFETELNANEPGDERDTTTPRAMVNTLSWLLLDDILSAESKTRLQDWMIASKTGSKRLRAGLPADWRTGDKTGTGMNGAANNTAITWPSGRKPIVMAVYMSGSEMKTASLNRIHAVIAEQIAANFVQ